MSALEEALDAAMLADPDGGPWETALAAALEAALDYGSDIPARDILTEYRAAVSRLVEDGEA